MNISTWANNMVHELWSRIVSYCEAKSRIAEMRQRVDAALKAEAGACQKSETDIAEARMKAQYDIECANRDKVDAERAIAEKQRDLKLLKSRIDEESIPLVRELIEKSEKESREAIRQFDKAKRIATSLIDKIQKRIEFYENGDFDPTFANIQDLRTKLEYEYYNTERKLDAIHKVVGNWELPKSLRKRVDADQAFMDSLKSDEPWITQA